MILQQKNAVPSLRVIWLAIIIETVEIYLYLAKLETSNKLKTNLIFQTENLESTITIPDIRLHSNPSAFNVYCNVRHCVLEWQKKEASVSLASKNSVQSGDSDSDEEEEAKEPPIKLPKVSTI